MLRDGKFDSDGVDLVVSGSGGMYEGLESGARYDLTISYLAIATMETYEVVVADVLFGGVYVDDDRATGATGEVSIYTVLAVAAAGGIVFVCCVCVSFRWWRSLRYVIWCDAILMRCDAL